MNSTKKIMPTNPTKQMLPLLRLRLAVGLLAASFALACSAVLDTDSLSSNFKPKQDGPAAVDGAADTGPGDSKPVDTFIPLDTGGCISGKSCTVVGKLGRCSIGTSLCNDSGTGICSQKYSAGAETCNGMEAIHDEDCDGTKDNADSNAHQACGSGKYCAGSSCATGCWSNSQCTGSSNTCNTTSHVCKCGTAAACEQPNPVCSSTGSCRCDSNSTCKSKETCSAGVCNCGGSTGPASGPFCTSGACNPATGACDLAPTDAGPDKGPLDNGVTPDKALPDQAVVDQAVVDQAVPADQAAVH